MKLKTKELDGVVLNWVATAARFKWLKDHKYIVMKEWVEDSLLRGEYFDQFCQCEILGFDTIQMLGINLTHHQNDKTWSTSVSNTHGQELTQRGADLLTVIARTLVALIFGDEINIDESILKKLQTVEQS